MIISVPKEIKNNEGRVAITPAGVLSLKKAGHTIYIEKNAGIASGFSDQSYIEQGAIILDTAKEVWDKAELLLKVKEPIASEYQYFRPNLVLFTYLHLAAEPKLLDALLKNKIRSIAYETVTDSSLRHLPLLTPMSEIAGKLAVQEAVFFLKHHNEGRGILLDGAIGVHKGKVAVLGGGIVGTAAMKMALGLGADVTALDVSIDRLRYLQEIFNNRITTLTSNEYNIRKAVSEADVVISAVLLPGEKAPKLITEEIVKTMKKGAVIVDVAIDQGGCVEKMKATTHDDPVFIKHGVVHYGVANMPGCVPLTSTWALTNATLPYVLKIANKGLINALKEDSGLYKGVSTWDGSLTCEHVHSMFPKVSYHKLDLTK